MPHSRLLSAQSWLQHSARSQCLQLLASLHLHRWHHELGLLGVPVPLSLFSQLREPLLPVYLCFLLRPLAVSQSFLSLTHCASWKTGQSSYSEIKFTVLINLQVILCGLLYHLFPHKLLELYKTDYSLRNILQR